MLETVLGTTWFSSSSLAPSLSLSQTSTTFEPLDNVVTTSTDPFVTLAFPSEFSLHVISPGRRGQTVSPLVQLARRFATHAPTNELQTQMRLGREYGNDSVEVRNLHELHLFCGLFRRTHEDGAPPVFKFVLVREGEGQRLFVGRVVRPDYLGRGVITVDHTTIARNAKPKDAIIAGFGGFDSDGRLVISIIPSMYYGDAIPRAENVEELADFLGGNASVWFAENPEDPYFHTFEVFLEWYRRLPTANAA
ncbi:MAG: hypothetical protein Q7T03_07435 [Deltaproteobacteria bacterium]|nr:hypothetical protein [Deltaproteobacteria bacterium]